jgi:translation elongation factor EF-Ts
MKKIKVAVVGTGNICRSAHMPVYMKREDVEVIACADIDLDKAKKFAEDFKIPAAYASVEELLANCKPDYVDVCTWPAAHAPVSIAAEDCPKDVVEKEYQMAIEKTKEEQIQKAVDAALKKAGINPAHVDSEDHIESNTAKGWLKPEQAQQAREIKKTVAEQKAANLPEQMIQNIANGRIQKFYKENTLEEQAYQMGDGKQSVKEYLKGIDAEAKVVVFKRFTLSE